MMTRIKVLEMIQNTDKDQCRSIKSHASNHKITINIVLGGIWSDLTGIELYWLALGSIMQIWSVWSALAMIEGILKLIWFRFFLVQNHLFDIHVMLEVLWFSTRMQVYGWCYIPSPSILSDPSTLDFLALRAVVGSVSVHFCSIQER